jgi:hypothetical protein
MSTLCSYYKTSKAENATTQTYVFEDREELENKRYKEFSGVVHKQKKVANKQNSFFRKQKTKQYKC